MLAVVNALSAALVAQIANAGYPPLRKLPNGDAGRILLVDAHRLDQFMPPRVAMIPARSRFGPRANSRGPVRVADNANGYDAESKAAIATKAIHTDEALFEVRVWGVANETEDDPTGRDWDYTIALRDALIAAANETMKTNYQLGDGSWEVVSHGKRVGREFVFAMSLEFPILDRVLPAAVTAASPPPVAPGRPFAPGNVAPNVTDEMQIKTIEIGGPNAESSPGCE